MTNAKPDMRENQAPGTHFSRLFSMGWGRIFSELLGVQKPQKENFDVFVLFFT